jgi:serine/threonine protein kinase
MVRPDGTVALIDFGAARDLAKGVTHNATLVGTFGYMPFEQLGGTVDPSCDLYALGATLIHLLAQKPPWEMMPNGAQLEFEPHLKVSPAFVRWLRRMVSPPRARFRTAEEALAALEALQPRPAEIASVENTRLRQRSADQPSRLGSPRTVAVVLMGAFALLYAAEYWFGMHHIYPALPPDPQVVAPVAPPAPRVHHPAGPIVDGFDDTASRPNPGARPSGPTGSEVSRFFSERASELQSCAESASGGARVLVSLTLVQAGRIADVRVSDPQHQVALDECLLDTIRTWNTPFHPAEDMPVEFPVIITR